MDLLDFFVLYFCKKCSCVDRVSPIQATAGRLHGKPVSPTKNGVHAVVGVSSSVASTKAHHTNGSFSARTTTANTARTNSSHSHSVASQPDSSATVKEHHRDGAERVNSAGSGTGSETNGKPSASGVISNVRATDLSKNIDC